MQQDCLVAQRYLAEPNRLHEVALALPETFILPSPFVKFKTLLKVSIKQQRQTLVPIGLSITRFDRDGFVTAGNSGLQVPECSQRVAAIAMGFSKIRHESDGCVVAGDRGIQLPEFLQRMAPIAVGFRKIRFYGDGFVVTLKRARELLEFQ